MRSLYNIKQEFRDLTETLIENGGEVTPEIDEQLTLTRDELGLKAANLALLTREMDGHAAALDAEIKRLQEYKKAVTSTSERIKDKISSAMQEFGVDKIESDLVRVSFRKSEETIIEDDRLIPEIYKEYVPNISKADIRTVLKAGVDVPGAYLMEKQNIQIR